jgi:hypothetical protein
LERLVERYLTRVLERALERIMNLKADQNTKEERW